jgi:hypothetical protein
MKGAANAAVRRPRGPYFDTVTAYGIMQKEPILHA